MSAETINLSDKITTALSGGVTATNVQIAKMIFGEQGHPSMVNRTLSELRREGKIRKNEAGQWGIVDLAIDGMIESMSNNIDEYLHQRWTDAQGVGYAATRENIDQHIHSKGSVPDSFVVEALARSIKRGKIVSFQDLRISADVYYAVSEKAKVKNDTVHSATKQRLLEYISQNDGWIPTKILVKALCPAKSKKSEYKNYRRQINSILYKMLRNGTMETKLDDDGKNPQWRLISSSK